MRGGIFSFQEGLATCLLMSLMGNISSDCVMTAPFDWHQARAEGDIPKSQKVIGALLCLVRFVHHHLSIHSWRSSHPVRIPLSIEPYFC